MTIILDRNHSRGCNGMHLHFSAFKIDDKKKSVNQNRAHFLFFDGYELEKIASMDAKHSFIRWIILSFVIWNYEGE